MRERKCKDDGERMRLGHETRKCEFCGGEFVVRTKSRRKTCSRKCSDQMIKANRKARYINASIMKLKSKKKD